MANDNSPKFTGGESLEGIQKIYHEIMMKNELSDGKGAYKLSYAGGASGIVTPFVKPKKMNQSVFLN